MLGALHNELQLLEYVTSPDIMQKASYRVERRARQRAVARSVAQYYKDMDVVIGSAGSLMIRARRHYSQGLSESEVAIRLENELSQKVEDVSPEATVAGIMRVANRSADDAIRRLGGDPDKVKPLVVALLILLSGDILNDLFGASDTYIGRQSRTVSQIANPVTGVPYQESVLRLQAELVWNRRVRATSTAQTTASTAENGSAHGVLEELVEERRLITMDDDRVCEICLGDAAQGWLPADQNYESGHMYPPIHPNCRCYEEGRKRRPEAEQLGLFGEGE